MNWICSLQSIGGVQRAARAAGALLLAVALLAGCEVGPERAPRQPISGVDRPSEPVRTTSPAAPHEEEATESEEEAEESAPEKS